MTNTVFFTSRIIGDPVHILDVRCDDLRFEHEPDHVLRGADGSEQRSIKPYVVTLINANRQDLAGMQGVDWTHMGWNEGPRTLEHEVRTIQVLGADIRCVYKGLT